MSGWAIEDTRTPPSTSQCADTTMIARGSALAMMARTSPFRNLTSSAWFASPRSGIGPPPWLIKRHGANATGLLAAGVEGCAPDAAMAVSGSPTAPS